MSVVLGFGQRVIGVALWGYCEGAVVQCFVRNHLFVKESMGGKESWRALCYNLVIFLYFFTHREEWGNMSGAKGWHCPCGHDFVNNCAHRLSHAIGHQETGLAPAPVSTWDAFKAFIRNNHDIGHVFVSDGGYTCCKAGRFLRADEMLKWYEGRGYKKHAQPNGRGDSVVYCSTVSHIYAINSSGSPIAPSLPGDAMNAIAGFWY